VPPLRSFAGRASLPALIFALTAGVYAVTLGARATRPSPGNHYVHLADGWLHGRLDLGGAPPGANDWACFDVVERRACPPGRPALSDPERYRWFVSFPPFPAALLVPFVAVFGTGLLDRLVWALFAGSGPALLFVVLRMLRETGRSERTTRDDLILTFLFAFGTVYYFTAVQGTVWFAAHVVATALLCLYLLHGVGARRPLAAGTALGLAFLTRPTTILLAIFFAVEALRACRRPDAEGVTRDAPAGAHVAALFRGADLPAVARRLALFGVPLLACGAVAMALNQARFGDPFEFGHTYLQIRWRGRIETWGLFNYHYLARNLAVALTSLPWLSAAPPYLRISRHGLALWVTTPNLLYALWPRRTTPLLWALVAAIVPVALLDLAYQNSGWVQFGYRFSLDYLPLVFVLLAIGGRRFGRLFLALAVLSVGINTFGAITFDRAYRFYDADATQQVLFQPD